MENYMYFKEYPIFQTLKESKIFCQQNSKTEKRKLLFDYIRQRDSLFTESQTWSAPSIYYLQYLLNGLYDLDESYSEYGKLSFLEKHGIAHLIISLSAPYWEGTPALCFAKPQTIPPQYIVYISPEEYQRHNNTYRKIWIFTPLTYEKREIKGGIPTNLKADELKPKLQNIIKYQDELHISEDIFFNYDPDYVNYFGNYIHKAIKQQMGHKEEWIQIKTLRNRLAHPHEGISEPNLKKACDILCTEEFIEDIEALVFLLSPLLPRDQQTFCQYGYHSNKEKYAHIAHGVFRILNK